MQTAATDSSLEVDSWFLNRARSEDWLLEHEKLQSLLFLAQMHYLATHPQTLLMPSLFISGSNAYADPVIAKLHAAGQLPEVAIRFSPEIDAFLEKIWNIYGLMSNRQINGLIEERIGSSDSSGSQKTIVDFKTLVEKFKSNSKINTRKAGSEPKNKPAAAWPAKVMLSQNGPVVVSQWKPRKLLAKNAAAAKIQS